jgi:hypothetical protein
MKLADKLFVRLRRSSLKKHISVFEDKLSQRFELEEASPEDKEGIFYNLIVRNHFMGGRDMIISLSPNDVLAQFCGRCFHLSYDTLNRDIDFLNGFFINAYGNARFFQDDHNLYGIDIHRSDLEFLPENPIIDDVINFLLKLNGHDYDDADEYVKDFNDSMDYFSSGSHKVIIQFWNPQDDRLLNVKRVNAEFVVNGD